jgi:hypothetical protein
MRKFALFMSFVFLGSAAAAQQRKDLTTRPPDLFTNLPSALHHQTHALGNRVLVAGKEKTTFEGQFMDDKGKNLSLRLTLQLPRAVRLEGLTKDGPPLVFDGSTGFAGASHLEEALLETFSSDTAEGMMASLQDGAAVQLVARRVQPESSGSRGEAAAACDVYEVSGSVRSTATAVERLKRYCFDSETGLLVSTRYADEMYSPPMSVEVRFSGWHHVDGSAYPGRIERLENGQPTFSLDMKSINAGPR